MKHILMHAVETLTSAGGQVAGDTLLDLETVNNLSFDDMEEAPGFVNPPDGIYNLLLTVAKIEKYKTKAVPATATTPEKPASDNNTRISHYYKIEEVVELSNSAEQAPGVGSQFSERFQANEQGMKFWKTKAKQILGPAIQGSNLSVASVLNELSAGTYRFKARVKQKETQGKGANAGKTFKNIQVQVLEVPVQPELEGGQVTTDETKI